MPRTSLQFWHLLVIVLMAAMLGTGIGDLVGKALPDSSLGRVLSAGVTVGTTVPWTLDLRVVTLTVGVLLRLSILGGIGAAVALLLFFRRV
jgi:hypothetical protein